ncbi:MAG: hypothetical protein VX777_00635 [Chlamydiota bacterium]|nr:hypothetical protein [Chlamydiota bacterium]
MTVEAFKIYVDRLREGKVECIDETFSSDFLDQNSDDLSFSDPVKVGGEAYIVDNELVMRLDVQTVATLPCSICNEPVKVPVDLNGIYHVESLDDIKSGVYMFDKALRETIIIDAPRLTECTNGKCPKREEFADYLSKDKAAGQKVDDEDGYQPFANLDLDQ